ncbi:hypothetical protein TanjilG_19078 [Lupinus angustifolius]|uniref:DUF4408 domain-containing protein n=1 Tax=Lupinus angustifolius TaxID=3871 RepID=A0A4P1RRS5_LUPAN|nr:PREDICTED: uncharacterized protein LOC109342078 [Lupinus angustifolius]OIW16362.1 hypothetical protein TanjilG_19078 [Lupinus angustifolius]
MNKVKKSEVIVLFVLALLLVITPSLPSSLRPTYLYFIFNLLIIALGAEAGLLSALEDIKQKPTMPSEVIISEKREGSNITITSGSDVSEHNEKKPKVVEKFVSAKIHVGVVKVDKVNKCPSMPSIFFIGSGEADFEEVIDDDEEIVAEDEIVEGVNGQELFTKAEAFIGNFYKQLKMQGEESWIY